ncbi:MAG: hypothetical protein Q7R66_00110 [Undibacterium sp.]|uniref:hypothetical protein n=1 Tax=Undibacterium sp. TaxID=1914977 RepID=UPI002728B2D1|nr:hypothetical protein [Undibacterium sp.]MDO8650579.1 hypothetical protein [Undibacterium sp.]
MKKSALLALLFSALLGAESSAESNPQVSPPSAEMPLAASADAGSETVSEAVAEVEVSSTKNPDWKRYRVMLKGLDAFDRHHALAPQAEQKFILKPRKAEVSIKGVVLRLASDDSSRPIALAEDGTFALPRDAQAAQADAELMINRKKELFRWWPYIRSPQLAANQRRLGDLRLECEMFWAIYYDDLPFLARNFVRTLGGPCTSKNVSLSFPADFSGLRSATLRQGARSQVLVLEPNQAGFSAPLYDQSLSDDAIIELEYDDNLAVKKTNYSGLSVGISF